MTSIDYDWEFLEDGRHIDPISIGMVSDDGREYYAVNALLASRSRKGRKLRRRIRYHDPAVKPMSRIADEVMEFIRATGPAVQLWANYGSYDHVCLAQMWGRMVDLPEGVPMFTNDIQQEARRLGIGWDQLPKQESGEHNALADARHNQTVRRWLADRAKETA